MRASLLVCALLVACDAPRQCIARGSTTTYAGNASYTGQAPGGAPLAGARAASLVVHDFDTSCTYDAMEFMIEIGACQLRATLGATTLSRGSFASANATIEADQDCELDLEGGSASVHIDSGLLSIQAGSAMHAELGGPLTALNGAPVTAGRIDWRFDGD